MKRAILLLMLLGVANAEFLLDQVTVTIKDIQKDGSASVQESIKFVARGNNSRKVYDNGYAIDANLSYWSSNTGLEDVRMHVNPAKSSVTDFRLTAQPPKGCSPFLNLCHGELQLDYKVSAIYNTTAEGRQRINGTGIFNVDSYKPRVTRYSINPGTLQFTNTETGSIILDEEVRLYIQLPAGSYMSKTPNPQPSEITGSVPGYVSKLGWNDMILVRFSLDFEVEESIDKEVVDFFTKSISSVQKAVNSPHGISLIIVVGILIGAYIYVNITKKKREG